MAETKTFNGNSEQIRIIAEQLVAAFSQNPPRHFMDKMDERIEEKLTSHQARFENRILRWLIAQFVAIAVAAFFLGGLWIQMAAVPATLSERGEWMNGRERWEQSVESWAEPQGFKPPRERRDVR